MLAPLAKYRIAGSRDCTTRLLLPSKATAIGCPTTCGTEGSGAPPQIGCEGSGGGTIVLPLVPAAPLVAGSVKGRPNPGLQGPCVPSGMQPASLSVTLPVSDTNTRDRDGVVSPWKLLVALPADTNAIRLASAEIARSTAS